ncbi:unnamed protein product [Lymnaea stagnalis]|uniref:Uncharacterized protein n=1 Tax=Lymnaea stagnalis TaxID=6523 RepID=A0AAV2I315_LYMST
MIRKDSSTYRDGAGSFEEGRHLRVAVSNKGLSVTSLLLEDRRKRERFEKQLLNVINGNIQRITSKTSLAAFKTTAHHYKQLAKTPVTSWKKTPSFLKEIRNQAAEDTQTAFRNARKSSVRLMPIRIVLPAREVSTAKDEVVPPAPVTKEGEFPPSKRLSRLSSCNARRPHGSIATMSALYKMPRRDPYSSSPWTFEERKCFFTTNFTPPHLRKELPLSIERQLDQDVAKINQKNSIE